MAAVRTLVAIPTASFEFPAREWQDPMAAGGENREGKDLSAKPAPTRDPLDTRGRAPPSSHAAAASLRPHLDTRDWARAGVREARPSARSRPLDFGGNWRAPLPRTLNWKRGNAGEMRSQPTSWILQPDLLVLPLDFESPALGASATALGQPRSAGTSSGHRDRHGTRPTEQGSPGPVPSGWRLLGTHRNCVSETHGQDKLQLPEASAVIPPPGVAPAKGRREGALQPRIAGFPAPSLGGRLGAFRNTED